MQPYVRIQCARGLARERARRRLGDLLQEMAELQRFVRRTSSSPGDAQTRESQARSRSLPFLRRGGLR
jgi:hypothetical protein